MSIFAHIINMVSQKENAAFYEMQKLTIASLEKAKQYGGNVNQYVCYHKDFPVDVPNGFGALPALQKSVLDLGGFKGDKTFPLLKDIIEQIDAHCNAEYIIYSNADIGLMPQFYKAIEAYIAKGHDALVINRRRIKSTLNKVEDLDIVYSELGRTHIGYDMFVFKKELIKKFILNNTCVGIPFHGNDLFYNLFCFANNPVLLADQHLTFHIGLELTRNWGSAELQKHNYKEFRKTTKALQSHIDITKFPGAHLGFFKRHFKWLMNPTLSYTELAKADLKQLGKPRKKNVYDPNYKRQSYYEWLIQYISFFER